jgi:hypothetical protein
MADWWGFANAISMVASVAIRWCLVQENTDGLDHAAVNACYGPSAQHPEERVKLLVTLSDGKMITIYAPRGLVVHGVTRRISPPRHQLYLWAKRFGWLFFGVHIIALGQSGLVSQLYTVILLVVSTWATVQGLGSNESEIGNHIEIETMKSFPEGPDRRLCAYVKLWPIETQEQSLIDLGLLPRKLNFAWWNEYQQSKDLWAKKRKTHVHCGVPREDLMAGSLKSASAIRSPSASKEFGEGRKNLLFLHRTGAGQGWLG